MTPLLLTLMGAYGVFLLYTALAMGWEGLGPSARPRPRRILIPRRRMRETLNQAGLADVAVSELAAVCLVLSLVGGIATWTIFGGAAPPLLVAAFAATFPAAAARLRRQRRMAEAREAWPRMIEEMRLLTASVGQSIPQALFHVGSRAPEELQPAFEAARREWLISTDFVRTATILKERLADPTADATLETLLIAHEVGGTDIDKRLAALVEDRVADLQGRKDARSRQAGVRFARRFVLLVPLGMALVGLSIGNGRAAYSSDFGQAAVVVGLVLLGVCWFWAGRLLRLPEEERVFHT